MSTLFLQKVWLSYMPYSIEGMKRVLGLMLVLCIPFFGCTEKKAKRFQKLAASRTGIDFINQLQITPELNILTYLYYYNGAGVAVADFNNDGLPDIFFG